MSVQICITQWFIYFFLTTLQKNWVSLWKSLWEKGKLWCSSIGSMVFCFDFTLTCSATKWTTGHHKKCHQDISRVCAAPRKCWNVSSHVSSVFLLAAGCLTFSSIFSHCPTIKYLFRASVHMCQEKILKCPNIFYIFRTIVWKPFSTSKNTG